MAPRRKTVCKTCPFRREGFLRLKAADADELAEFISDGGLGICHATQREVACRGAEIFAAGGSAAVFGSALEMRSAHATSPKPIAGRLWGTPSTEDKPR